MSCENQDHFSEFLLTFSKSANFPEEWVEKFKLTLLRWLNETPDQIKADLVSCLDELEHSTKRPGRTMKFISALVKEIVKHLAKDPGGKSRYRWADKAYFMRQELKLNYEYIYPAVCQEATGKRLEELSDSEKQEFMEQCRGLVYQRRVEGRKERGQNKKKIGN